MGKVDAGLFDATLLAEAGLTRLDMKDVTRYPISEEIIVPAPGQAAIAVQTRDEDGELQTLLQQIHDAKTEREVTIERSLLKRLGGGCALPLGCVCHIEGETAELRVFYANASGTEHYLATHRTPLSDIDTLLSQLIERLQHITTA
jgi:hydroxymethylbilane synthase